MSPVALGLKCTIDPAPGQSSVLIAISSKYKIAVSFTGPSHPTSIADIPDAKLIVPEAKVFPSILASREVLEGVVQSTFNSILYQVSSNSAELVFPT